MPQISVNDLKNGITLELDNGLFQVIEFQHEIGRASLGKEC